MKPQPPSSAQSSRRVSRLDRRATYLPAEIPSVFHPGSRRFEASRPATTEAQRFQHTRDRYAAETTSYFPKIRENAIARDKREKQLALKNSTCQVWREPFHLCQTPAKAQQTSASVSTKPLSKLDQDGMAAMRFAFEKQGHLDETEFLAEMLYALNADNLEWEQQVSLTHELGSLYRQADLHAVGFLTWEDFSSTIFKASDENALEETTNSQRNFQTDALKLSAELNGLYYFDEVDRLFLHDARNKGFRMLDAFRNTVAGEYHAPSRGGGILDAVYSPIGRYVITASTSPVIALYDVDQLRIRQIQQIPTEAGQTALELERDPTLSRLYSSCTNGQVHVWNMDTLSCVHSFFSKDHEVMTDLAAIDSTSQIATSCMDGKIYVLDLHLERIGKSLNGHRKGVTMIKYHAHKGYLISGGLDHYLHVWSPHVEQKVGSLKGHRHQLIGLEVIPETPQLISADESGLIKIWDLRMFAPVQMFKREVYVKDALPRTLTRPMRSMCYMPSRKRIVIAHSSIFFIDVGEDKETYPGDEVLRAKPSSSRQLSCYSNSSDHKHKMEERVKPLTVVFNPSSSLIVIITPRELQSWAVDSGHLVHKERFCIRGDVTCVSIVDDQHSCIIGTENGTLARVMLPRGAMILSKRLHAAEVAAVRWVSGSRQVVSSSFDGTVLISLSNTFEVLHTLNHWRGFQSVNANCSRMTGNDDETTRQEPPHALCEVEHLTKLFNSADYTQNGKITVRKANELLDCAFPIPQTGRGLCRPKKVYAARETITLPAFLKRAQGRLKEIQRLSVPGGDLGGSDAVMIDVHSKLQHLVTISPFDGTFCAWNINAGTVVATGIVKKGQRNDKNATSRTRSGNVKLKTSLISQVVYLDPFPYFVLVEEDHPCRVSIWSSKAISSVLPCGHQRIVCLLYGTSSNPQQDSQHDEDLVPHNPHYDSVVCAALWVSAGTSCGNFFCIGDDQGYVTIYSFDEFFQEIEAIRKDSRSQHLDEDKLLSSSLLRLHSQWLIRQGDSIRTLCVLPGSAGLEGNIPLIVVTLDSGATSFFTIEGSCIGALTDRSVPWQLRASTSECSVSTHIAAAKMLQEIKTQRRVTQTPQRQQSQFKQDWLRRVERLTSTGKTRDKSTEEYAKQRPGLSRFLAVANQL